MLRVYVIDPPLPRADLMARLARPLWLANRTSIAPGAVTSVIATRWHDSTIHIVEKLLTDLGYREGPGHDNLLDSNCSWKRWTASGGR
jgi:hypothetical protein